MSVLALREIGKNATSADVAAILEAESPFVYDAYKQLLSGSDVQSTECPIAMRAACIAGKVCTVFPGMGMVSFSFLPGCVVRMYAVGVLSS